MPKNNHFTILITSYNCAAWVEKNLGSVHDQEYKNFDVIYIDDNSTDNTYVEASRFNNLKTLKNTFNKGKMQNVCESIKFMRQDTIVVILDGDDWLYDKLVLSKLNEVYNSGEVWMTNGSYIVEPTNEIIRPNIKADYWSGNIRQKSWEFSHLGSFRKELFEKIKKKDFMNSRGEYWSTTSDQAIMWPLVEMAGPEHHRCIDAILYVYNRLNPLSDDRVHRQDQLQTEKTIRSLRPYGRLAAL